MTTHKEADIEVAELKDRYVKVKLVSDEWMKKCDTLVKEWQLLDNTVTELNSWVAADRGAEGEQNFSLEKMESTLGELKNIFKEKEKLVESRGKCLVIGDPKDLQRTKSSCTRVLELNEHV